MLTVASAFLKEIRSKLYVEAGVGKKCVYTGEVIADFY